MGALTDKKVHPESVKNKSKSNEANQADFPMVYNLKNNGWSLPLHPLQVVALSSFFIFTGIFFGLIVPFIPWSNCKSATIVVSSLIFLSHFIVHIVSISVNPADTNVIAKYQSFPSIPSKFDRTKHSHVIENQFCYVCEVNVGPKSKHCSVCNKCIADFDHHCKWLNNCVGGRNYRLFITCVITAAISILIILSSSSFFVAAYFNSKSWLYANTTSSGDESNVYFQELPPNIQKTWVALLIISVIMSSVVFLLLFHLLCFHIFLNCLGLSTYEFIVSRRQSKGKEFSRNPDEKVSKSALDARRIRSLKALTFVVKMSNQIHDSSSQEPKSNDNTDGVQYEKAEIFNTYPEV